MSRQAQKNDSSFTTRRINKSTFVVQEDDIYLEHPLIYVKIHPKAPVIIVSDTGCDEPSEEAKHRRFIHLRDYLEHCSLPINNGRPLNPKGHRTYIVICTHCHYDHIGGITQFLRGGTTEIIASSAGRDFIESDLDGNSEFRNIGGIAPYYEVTHWAQHFERMSWPLQKKAAEQQIDLGITLIPDPGHTPDSLAWYDHDEMHLYVGDTLYEEGPDKMRIIWPGQGNFVEWVFQTSKLQYMVQGENARARATASVVDMEEDDWVQVAPRVKIGCGHQTYSSDAEELFSRLGIFGQSVLRGEIPEVEEGVHNGEIVVTWREKDGKSGLSFLMPRRLMEDARRFFSGTIIKPDDSHGQLSLFAA